MAASALLFQSNSMTTKKIPTLRLKLQQRRELLESQLERIRANVTRPLDQDSKERAKEMEDSDVVDALGIGARDELAQIRATLGRIDEGTYGSCHSCGNAIDADRLEAWPYASQCIDCARASESSDTHA
jgi:RNA polymerase-binding transcription factor DksA